MFLGEIIDDNEAGESPESYATVPVSWSPASAPIITQKQPSETDAIKAQYSVHYRNDIIPSLLEAVNFVIRNHSDDTLLAHTLYPLGIFVYNVVLTTEVSNEDFINNVLISTARLNDKNVENNVINPILYIGWNMQHTANVTISFTLSTFDFKLMPFCTNKKKLIFFHL